MSGSGDSIHVLSPNITPTETGLLIPVTETYVTELELSVTPVPTDAGTPTGSTTDRPETDSSTTEMGTSTSLSDIVQYLVIALAVIVFIILVVLLLIICVAIYYCSTWKSGGYSCCLTVILATKSRRDL